MFSSTSWIFLVWRSLLWCFSLYLRWHFFCCCTCTSLNFMSCCGSIYFFFITNATFLLLFVDFVIFMFIFIITRLYWDGLFTKKESIISLSCVSVAIIVSVLDVWQFVEVKTSTSVSPMSSDSLFWWLLFVYWKIMTLLELPCLGFRLYPCCSPPCPVLDL